MTQKDPYNPLAKTNLGESVADALLRAPVRKLGEPSEIAGAGVYAIYYVGNFPLYKPITDRNKGELFEQPIYVGRAVPKGARKGGANFDAGKGSALRDRLRQHAGTIEGTNLNLADFYYRALTVDDIWIPLGENVVIEKFQPLWNRVIDGFGNKTPGKGRGNQKRSSWDVLHPGRAYVSHLKLAPGKYSQSEITRKVHEFFAGRLPVTELLQPGTEDEGEEKT